MRFKVAVHILIPEHALELVAGTVLSRGVPVRIRTLEQGRGLFVRDDEALDQVIQLGALTLVEPPFESEVVGIRYARARLERTPEHAIQEPGSVVFEGLASPVSPEMLNLFERFAREIGEGVPRSVRVKLYSDATTVTPEPSDGAFHIHFWASPGREKVPGYPRQVQGVAVASTHGFVGTGAGARLFDDALCTFGEIVDRNHAFIHVSFGPQLSDELIPVVQLLLGRLTALLRVGEAQWPALLEEMRREVLRASSRVFAQANPRDYLADLRRTEKERDEVEQRLQTAWAALRKARSARDAVQIEFDRLSAAADEEREGARLALASLERTPGVQSVTVGRQGDRVIVYTEFLQAIAEDGTRYRVGAFQCHLIPGALEDECIRIYNRTQTYAPGTESCPHAPHVDELGRPRFWGASKSLPRLVRERQWQLAVEGLIAFLQSVNVHAPGGSFVSSFPSADTAAE
jgi:hypothetical protein